jgi:Patatin-like phospholipase
MKALQIFAGPRALARIRERGLSPSDIRAIPAAAGGPKGLTLLPLDRFLFGEWLPQSTQPVDLIGASIGAWRMASAMLNDPVAAIASLEHAYIRQDFDVPPGRKSPTREHVSARFAEGIQAMFGQRVDEVLSHSRYRLHVLTSRGRHILGRDHGIRTPLGYAGAFLSNVASRKAMGAWLERAVFSSHISPLPFAANDYRTRRYALSDVNFASVVQASCSIPFVLNAVHDIPGAPRGAYWDGGITDYHLHLDYRSAAQTPNGSDAGLVLYPHFQRAVVPGWLDKSLKWRHRSTHFLDDVIVLAPRPDWVATLPNHKLPDRTDFVRYGRDLPARVAAWQTAVAESERLGDEFADWANSGADIGAVAAL